MPNKKTKLARRTGAKDKQTPQARDDGSRWIVVRHGRPVYPSHGGSTRAEAERLAEGLSEPAEIMQLP